MEGCFWIHGSDTFRQTFTIRFPEVKTSLNNPDIYSFQK